MDLKNAHKIATGICYLLQPHCEPERIRIAGSIRRRKSDVKDIEIVCLPSKTTHLGPTNLFGEAAPEKVTIKPEFETLVNNLGEIETGRTSGRYLKIMLPEGIKLDLFMPEASDFWRQFAIRTGSKDYAARMIASSWTKKGWCGTSEGLRKMVDCEKKVYKDPERKRAYNMEGYKQKRRKAASMGKRRKFF